MPQVRGFVAWLALAVSGFASLTAPSTLAAAAAEEGTAPEPISNAEGLNEIRLLWFGPSDAADPLGGDPWLAAGLAVEELNARGGYGGLPFRLISIWSDNPWGTGVARLARSVYADGPWAIVGSTDGASAHLAETVVAKARLVLIDSAGTDKTVNLANVPWAFSCLPADDRLMPALAATLRERIGEGSFVTVSTTDHDSHHTTRELHERLALAGVTPLRHVELAAGVESVPAEVVASVAAFPARAIVVIAGPLDSARLVVALREATADRALFGGPAMGRRAFIDRAADAAEGVVFPLTCDPEALSGRFARQFAERTGRTADCTTLQAYDAVHLVAAAVGRAGLDREAIREAVAGLSPWSGAAGPLRFNSRGQNQREVRLATVKDGRVVPLESAH